MSLPPAVSVSVPPRPNGFWHRRVPKEGLVVYSRRGKALLWTGGRVPVNGPVLWWAMAACAVAGAAGALAGRSL